jgi:hypothetical protein
MKRCMFFIVVTACATPPPAAVAIAPLPVTPVCAETPAVHPPQTPDDVDYTSNRGIVHLALASDGRWAGTYPDGVLTCDAAVGSSTKCRWYTRSSEGRAVFTRQPDGHLAGTWGNGASTEDGGDWTLVPVSSEGELHGLWDTNWGVAAVSGRGARLHIDYPNGSMECDVRESQRLACQWTEASSSGEAELVIESLRVLRGRWGSGASAKDGGPWVFVKR